MAWQGRILLVVGLMAWAACGADPGDAAEVELEVEPEDEGALQGGATTSAYPAVGMVVAQSGKFCSGTLIRDDVVLTAAHCADEPVVGFYTGRGRALTDAQRAARGLAPALATMTAHGVAEQIVHPAYDADWCGDNPDLALLRLDEPVDDIAPLRLATTGAAYPGRRVRAVGYGVHGKGASRTQARKRAAWEVIVDVTADAVEVRADNGLADHGDSGGPILCGRKVCGVTSCGPEGSWRRITLFYSRPDVERAWVDEVLAGWE